MSSAPNHLSDGADVDAMLRAAGILDMSRDPLLPSRQAHATARGTRALRHDLAASKVVMLRAGDALETLRLVRRANLKPAVVMLDPPYEPGKGQSPAAYRTWLVRLVRASARVADHVLLWGMPPMVGPLVERAPRSHPLCGWITWAITNAVTRQKTWRPGHQVCLHFAKAGAKLHTENFYNEAQRELAQKKQLQFQPTPSTVISAALVAKSKRRHEHEKPESVVRTLLLMATTASELVIDPMCGSGVTAEVALDLGRRVVLSDVDADVVAGAMSRLIPGSPARYPGVNPTKPVRIPASELEKRRRAAVALRRTGRSLTEVAKTLGVTRQAIWTWCRASDNGALGAVRREGRKSFLSLEQMAVLGEIVRKEPHHWTGPLLASRIEEEFGVRYQVDTARRLLRRLRPA